MSEAFEEFRRAVFEDPELMRRLLEERDDRGFASLAAALAEERGLRLTKEEALEAVREGRRVWYERRI